MTLALPEGMQINAPILPGFETILTPPALASPMPSPKPTRPACASTSSPATTG